MTDSELAEHHFKLGRILWTMGGAMREGPAQARAHFESASMEESDIQVRLLRVEGLLCEEADLCGKYTKQGGERDPHNKQGIWPSRARSHVNSASMEESGLQARHVFGKTLCTDNSLVLQSCADSLCWCLDKSMIPPIHAWKWACFVAAYTDIKSLLDLDGCGFFCSPLEVSSSCCKATQRLRVPVRALHGVCRPPPCMSRTFVQGSGPVLGRGIWTPGKWVFAPGNTSLVLHPM